MNKVIGHRSIPPSAADPAQRLIAEAINELNGVTAKPLERAVRLRELVAAGILKTGAQGQLQAGEELAKLRGTIAGISGTITGLSEGVSGIESAVVNLNGVLTLQTEQFTNLQSRLQIVEGSGDSARTRLEALSEANSQLLSQITATDNRLDVLSKDTTELLADVSINRGETSFLSGKVEANASAVETLEARVTLTEDELVAQATQITNLQADVTAIEGDITTLQGITGANASAISALDARVTVTEGEITTISSDVTALDNRLTSAEGDIVANSSAVASLDSRVTANEDGISVQATDIVDLTARLDKNPSGNIVVNPGFELGDNLRYWANSTTGGAWDSAFSVYTAGAGNDYAADGGKALRINANGGGAVTLYNQRVVQVNPSSKVRVSFKTGGSGNYVNAGANIRVGLRQYDQDNAYVANIYVGGTGYTAPGGVNWTTASATGNIDGEITLSASARSFQPFIYVNNLTSGSFFIDTIVVEILSPSALAQASATSALDARVTSNEGSISAQATQITALNATVGANSASITNISRVTAASNDGAGQALLDPGFERTDGWGSANAVDTPNTSLPSTVGYQSNASSSGYVHSGTRSLRFNDSSGSARSVFNNTWFRVTPGRKYRVTYWYRTWGGAPASGSYVRMTVRRYDAQGVYVSYSYATGQVNFNGSTSAGWTKQTSIYTVPDGDGIHHWALQGFVAGAGGVILVDDVSVELIDEETAAQWSLVLDVNDYVSGVYSANDGTTSNFTVLADTFSVVKPGGGARLEWSSGNLRVYDSGGTLRVRMGVW